MTALVKSGCEPIFISAKHLGGDHTRRYWGLDR